MIFKTKLLLSLAALGVAGGTGTGIYYLKQQNKQEVQEVRSASSVPGLANPPLSPAPAANDQVVGVDGARGSHAAPQQTSAQQTDSK